MTLVSVPRPRDDARLKPGDVVQDDARIALALDHDVARHEVHAELLPTAYAVEGVAVLLERGRDWDVTPRRASMHRSGPCSGCGRRSAWARVPAARRTTPGRTPRGCFGSRPRERTPRCRSSS